MSEDLFADDFGPEYTLILKAENDQDALDALEANFDIPVRTRSVRAIPLKPMRVLTVEVDLDEEGLAESAASSRSAIEGRLNGWMLRAGAEHPEGVGLPVGSLLWWRRGGR